jgi:hypothetical protein
VVWLPHEIADPVLHPRVFAGLVYLRHKLIHAKRIVRIVYSNIVAIMKTQALHHIFEYFFISKKDIIITWTWR